MGRRVCLPGPLSMGLARRGLEAEVTNSFLRLRPAAKIRHKGLSGKEIVVGLDPNELLGMLERHGAELHALFARITLRADVAEDLLQDLFLKLRNAEGFARAANRKAYLFQSAIHLAFDWRRAQR